MCSCFSPKPICICIPFINPFVYIVNRPSASFSPLNLFSNIQYAYYEIFKLSEIMHLTLFPIQFVFEEGKF